MKVEIAIDPNAMQSLASRVNAPAAAGGRGAGRAPAAAKARNGGRAAGSGSGRAAKPRAPRPAKKTAEDLDAEMAVSIANRQLETELTSRPTRRRPRPLRDERREKKR